MFCYIPQWRCRKVMFLHLSVILFTEGVSVPAGTTDHITGGSLSSGGVSIQGCLFRGVSVQGGLCSGGSLSRGVSIQGGLCLGGSLSRGISVRETPGQKPRHMVTSRRYASHWDAFLFVLEFFHELTLWQICSRLDRNVVQFGQLYSLIN